MKRAGTSHLVRLSTLLFLPVWMAALVCCSLESLPGHCQSDAPHTDYEKSDSHADHGHDSPAGPSPSKAPHSEGFCASLGSTVLTPAFVGVTPPCSELDVLVAWTVLAPTAENSTFAIFCRQAERRIWVFTVEVCTSPGNRSLAPPFFG
jgi:hypothetical protein